LTREFEGTEYEDKLAEYVANSDYESIEELTGSIAKEDLLDSIYWEKTVLYLYDNANFK